MKLGAQGVEAGGVGSGRGVKEAVGASRSYGCGSGPNPGLGPQLQPASSCPVLDCKMRDSLCPVKWGKNSHLLIK